MISLTFFCFSFLYYIMTEVSPPSSLSSSSPSPPFLFSRSISHLFTSEKEQTYQSYQSNITYQVIKTLCTSPHIKVVQSSPVVGKKVSQKQGEKARKFLLPFLVVRHTTKLNNQKVYADDLGKTHTGSLIVKFLWAWCSEFFFFLFFFSKFWLVDSLSHVLVVPWDF